MSEDVTSAVLVTSVTSNSNPMVERAIVAVVRILEPLTEAQRSRVLAAADQRIKNACTHAG